ncbi:TonB-dependent receptor [Sphingomonas sp. PAMC 26617]|uniref:TonB-dependent receptor n=1 Tax=Sphingomonas sp. PAMC 26617 TaxID=1112216 RepID=UPI001E49F91D|nr:TonB-dependent receptor [Sphingomonas sp. PAMC 26617]
MSMRNQKFLRLLLASAAFSAATTGLSPAYAQTSTAAIRGQVTDAAGTPVAGATVAAVSSDTNQTYRATTDANGGYTLNGLRPGSYQVTSTATDGQTNTQLVTVAIGQTASLDATVEAPGSAPGATPSGGKDIVVTGSRLRETRTSEIATNVSQAQIRALPQTDRNFLSFAALAPGVRYNDSETGKGIQSGASTASQVNVFIDGVSLKNKLSEGGIAGQQNSRGNPFGQLAVQEFRVLTQNYKAEYEQAGSAIITAVTKSGTNQFHGEVFGQYTGKGLSETSFIDKRDGNPKPDFTRKQYGIALGGPIIKDRLFFFGTYEGNDQNRALNVKSTGSADAVNEFNQVSGRRLSDFEAPFISPFRGDFYFGKLTLTPDDRQTFDASFSRRQETDIQNFGGNVSYENAENKRNIIDTYQFKWAYKGDKFVNEFNANYLQYTFNPTSLNPDLPTYDYSGVIIFGGKDSTRKQVQQSYTLRDDFTYSGVAGHTFKVGGRVEITDISFDNRLYTQPRYTFLREPQNNLNFTFPGEARLGLGNGLIQGSNTQIGLYAQDDWDITGRLQLNLGVRWDYETNAVNNDYITPVAAAAALRSLPATSYFNPENYISTGTNRKPFAGAIAPRVGFSWDIKGDRSTVIFGGFGRYYDRNNFNNTVDELSRSINPVGIFRFSSDGLPRNGLPTIRWDPAYGTRDGLLALRAASTSAGAPEMFAVKNNAKPPVNDQVSFGVRQRLGVFEASVTGSYQRGRNGYTNLFATRNDGGFGTCCNTSTIVPLGYSNVLIGYDGLDTRYKALFVTLDKNYTKTSGWGLNVAYTLSKGEQNGGDLFSLDQVTPDAYGWRPRDGDERHRVVVSGIVDLPLGFQFASLTTLGSGQAFRVTDGTNGSSSGFNNFSARYPQKNCLGGVFAFCEVNVTLSKKIPVLGKDTLEAAVDVLNLFNNNNFSGFDDFYNNTINPATGRITDPLDPARIGNSLLTLPRRIQFRLGYRF